MNVWQRFTKAFLLLVIISISTVHAQETHRIHEVGIISGRVIRSAAPSNIGDDGISRLEDMLKEFDNVNVQTIAPEMPIPPEVELVILIRPQRTLSIVQTTILWDFIERGGHILLALDPYGHAGSRNERASRGGITGLIHTKFGISVSDDFLIEPWFSIDSLANLVTSWSRSLCRRIVTTFCHPRTN